MENDERQAASTATKGAEAGVGAEGVADSSAAHSGLEGLPQARPLAGDAGAEVEADLSMTEADQADQDRPLPPKRLEQASAAWLVEKTRLCQEKEQALRLEHTEWLEKKGMDPNMLSLYTIHVATPSQTRGLDTRGFRSRTRARMVAFCLAKATCTKT